MGTTGGHVFAVHGDIMSLACDAWLVPGSSHPGKTWRQAIKWPAVVALPEGWGELDGPRVVEWPPRRVDADMPVPFLVDLAGTNRQGAEWYVAGAREFVRRASAHVKQRAPRHQRACHLLALPLVGTGFGGASHAAGDVVRQLLGALREEARAAEVDLALVLHEGPAFAAVQAERMRTAGESFAPLSEEQRAAAEGLAQKARDGDLVLFAGAGVSLGAGLPSWNRMLVDIAKEASISEVEAFRALGELDQAAILNLRFPDEKNLGSVVARHLRERATHYALTHGLLASLPVDEVITTNYDDLFERASAALGRPVTVLPHAMASRNARWLLKMHGCVSRPDSIVLTREDYLRFQENRTALAGIVQALLMTRHMLFVGFSFRDDNFHRIAHAVRSALGAGEPGHERSRFGTTLVVDPNPLARELWRHDLSWITFDTASPDEQAPSIGEQARRMEIFLDLLCARAATATSHLCDARYETVLSPAEIELRAKLEGFVRSATPEMQQTPAWGEVAKLLRRLGAKG